MPRRAAARLAVSTTASAEPAPSSFPPPPAFLSENLVLLRKQWKWAAISQFFFTFDALLAMDDVKLKDVEDDLVLGSSLVLPRIIVRLLYTLSYDRKVNLNNWQTTLRRQYNKRNPAANPIGPEPINKDDYFPYESPEPESTKMESDTREQSMVSASGQKNKDIDEGSTVKSEDGSLHPHFLSKEHSKNSPEQEQEQEPQESKDWLSLSMMEKLDSLHLLTEWQFQSPNRVRTLMKSDDDQASWRIEPIGYDAKRNAYWLIGADRLWIQRVPPKPPRLPPKTSLKRKRTAGSQKSLAKSSSPAKRPRLQSTAKTKSSTQAKSRVESTTAGGRQGRAAKDQANMKLDAQAKELAELNRQAGLLASGRTSRTRGSALLDSRVQSSPPARASGLRLTRTSGSSAAAVPTASTSARPLGTRLSARLRGLHDEEWQAIPDEWLDDNDNDTKGEGNEVGKERRTRAPSPSRSEAHSSISELTELTEDSSNDSVRAEAEEDTEEVEDKDEEDEDPAIVNDESKTRVQEITSSGEFVEWETLAVTLYDWEHIAERWENATHYSEKALYKVLTKHIVPIITEELKELDKIEKKKQKQKEEEIVSTGRKRSSRLAIKESEKEEAKAAARRKEEEEEKMSRARRAEARQQKEEADRISRESAREQRRREREAKEEQEAREAEEKERKEREKEERAKQRGTRQHNRLSSPVTNGAILLHHPGSNLSSANGSARGSRSRGSRTPAGDDWELDCEICHRRGINLDDDVPLLCCGSCSKWQHIRCHDQTDVRAGRPRRNWDQVDFVCLKCRSQSNASANSSSLGGASSVGVGGGYNGAGVGGVGGGVQMHYLPSMQNVHPSLRASNATGSAVAYNHVPYGYDPGSGARMGNGGYVGVRAVNGIGNSNPGPLKGSGYGTSDVRSSSQVHMSLSYANEVPAETQKMYYQSRQQQQPEFSNTHGRDPQHSGYRDHPPAGAGYGHSPTSYGPQYGNHHGSQNHNIWNGTGVGVSTNHSLGYPSTSSSSYMPSSAERSSALAESSSRYDPQSHYAHQQQGQQQWHHSQAQGLPQSNTNMTFASSPLGSASSFHPPPHRS